MPVRLCMLKKYSALLGNNRTDHLPSSFCVVDDLITQAVRTGGREEEKEVLGEREDGERRRGENGGKKKKKEESCIDEEK